MFTIFVFLTISNIDSGKYYKIKNKLFNQKITTIREAISLINKQLYYNKSFKILKMHCDITFVYVNILFTEYILNIDLSSHKPSFTMYHYVDSFKGASNLNILLPLNFWLSDVLLTLTVNKYPTLCMQTKYIFYANRCL